MVLKVFAKSVENNTLRIDFLSTFCHYW